MNKHDIVEQASKAVKQLGYKEEITEALDEYRDMYNQEQLTDVMNSNWQNQLAENNATVDFDEFIDEPKTTIFSDEEPTLIELMQGMTITDEVEQAIRVMLLQSKIEQANEKE